VGAGVGVTVFTGIGVTALSGVGVTVGTCAGVTVGAGVVVLVAAGVVGVTVVACVGLTLAGELLGISLGMLGNEVFGSSLGDIETLGNKVPFILLERRLGRSLGDIEAVGYVLGSDDGFCPGSFVAGVLREILGRSLGGDVVGISPLEILGRRLGRSLGDVLGILFGDIEARYVLWSDDGVWLGDLLALSRAIDGDVLGILLGARSLEDMLGNEVLGVFVVDIERLGNEVLGMLLERRLGRSLGNTLGISLGDIESLGFVLGSNDGIWLVDGIAEVLGLTLGRSLGVDLFGISGKLAVRDSTPV
jgi:hypothetical protein